ncbi:hypothetical protein BSL78_25888 [Apostichopus japonicus]|uniref:Fibrinogen C-terminal domain-containing protein n=1 Tax=Stichopus japonicus TaxID=307972 RepID=A0A2G8JNJ4_STIJA|nr:hypothetical protein BSL78_25888 [Apostichopus japonicus]
MSQKRYNSLMLLNVHKSKTDDLDLTEVARDFYSTNEHRRIFVVESSKLWMERSMHRSARYNPGPCPGAAPKPNDHVTKEATNLYSSKPVETTPMQTTSSETTGSTVREASESVETTPKQTTTGGDCPRDDSSIEMTNCLDWFNAGCNKTSTYTIKPTNWNGPPFEVFCNMTDGGGWTIMRSF